MTDGEEGRETKNVPTRITLGIFTLMANKSTCLHSKVGHQPEVINAGARSRMAVLVGHPDWAPSGSATRMTLASSRASS